METAVGPTSTFKIRLPRIEEETLKRVRNLQGAKEWVEYSNFSLVP